MGLPDNAGVDFKAESHIYTFQKVLLSITDPDTGPMYYSVARIRINLTESSYPAITMVIAPEGFKSTPELESTGSFEYPSQKKILAPTLQDFISENQRIQALVRKQGVTAGFELQMVRSDNVEKQSISIKNWVLTGSGVVRGTATGGWTVSISIAHPAYKATAGIGWIPNTADAMNAPTEAEGQNPVDLFLEALDDYYEQTEDIIDEQTEPEGGGGTAATVDIDCAASIAEVAEKSRERLKDAIEALRDSVEWDNGGGANLPFPEEAIAGSDYLLRSMWTQLSGQQPVWNQFVGQMSGFELTVLGGPTDDKLKVRPFTPWGKYALVIYDREVWSIDMPPFDTRDIAGVVSSFDGGLDADALSVYEAVNANELSTTAQLSGLAGYVCPLLATKPLSGPVIAVTPPAWIRDYLYDQGGGYDINDTPEGPDKVNFGAEDISVGGTPPETPDEADNVGEDIFPDYVAAVKKFCKQVFLRNYRSGAGVSLGTRLLIQSQDKYLLPGMVVRIDSVTEDEYQTSQKSTSASATPSLYFYITAIVHNIDVEGKEASTNLVGAFVRSPQDAGIGGFSAEAIADGISNPMYESINTGI